jgi:hypothetical protein
MVLRMMWVVLVVMLESLPHLRQLLLILGRPVGELSQARSDPVEDRLLLWTLLAQIMRESTPPKVRSDRV